MAKQIEIDFGDFSSFPDNEQHEDAPKEDPQNIRKPMVVRIEPEEMIDSQPDRPNRIVAKNTPSHSRESLPPDEELFKKAYYQIGEVAKMLGEEVSLVRYWSNEFKILKPRKNRKGDRYFRPEDVKNIYLIYDLLKVRKFTIEGAKKFLASEQLANEKFEVITSLKELKYFLEQLKNNL